MKIKCWPGIGLFMAALYAITPAVATATPTPTVVLVHGATADGSIWKPVYDILQRENVPVRVAQLPLSGLGNDVDALRGLVSRQSGPVVLVGHSYGGAVITVAGDDERVKALVYVAAFQPQAGESVADLNARHPLPTHAQQLDKGLMQVDPAFYAHDVAADIAPGEAAFLARSQRPTAVTAFTAKVPVAAWRDRPVYAVVATRDRILSARTQRFMCNRSGARTVEVASSHMLPLSHPRRVARVILEAVGNVDPESPAK